MSTIKINSNDMSKLNEIRKTISESHEIEINVNELERNLNDNTLNTEMEIHVIDEETTDHNRTTSNAEEIHTTKKLLDNYQQIIYKNIDLILYILIAIFVIITIFCLYKVYGIKYLHYGMRATIKRNRNFIKYYSH